MDIAKMANRMVSWLTLRRLRWKLRKYFPKAVFDSGGESPDPDRILQSHIERISHFWDSYDEPLLYARNRMGQKDEQGFVLLTEDDCTANGGEQNRAQMTSTPKNLELVNVSPTLPPFVNRIQDEFINQQLTPVERIQVLLNAHVSTAAAEAEECPNALRRYMQI
ncbi:unnamed protein product [Hydatigera taeniaeformis]|uniref:Uncharacterized protein n=1 Tax=Hydatigena taeniaeformis TaxID=6205 RepID=A0A0R3X245_HYDTA|nr:unnamed protein product [Hydatigera taeniaeformis]